jgi:hypothetical protein
VAGGVDSALMGDDSLRKMVTPEPQSMIFMEYRCRLQVRQRRVLSLRNAPAKRFQAPGDAGRSVLLFHLYAAGCQLCSRDCTGEEHKRVVEAGASPLRLHVDQKVQGDECRRDWCEDERRWFQGLCRAVR